MSETTGYTCSVPTPTLNTRALQSFSHEYQEKFIVIGFLLSLYGVLAILSMISWYTLLTRRSGKIQPTAVILCLTILALFTSTTIYVVAYFFYYHTFLMSEFLSAAENLWSFDLSSATPPPQWSYPDDAVQALFHSIWVQACGSAATLTVNVILGDAIVCWRACVVWHESYVAKAVCGGFLVATCVLGVIDTRRSCALPVLESILEDGGRLSIPGTLFEGLPIGIATCVLSLTTNILATLLVAYKGWQSRMRLKIYFAAKAPGGSQVEKLLTLLIESGAVYSAIWSVVVAFQVDEYKTLNGSDVSTLESNFIEYFGLIMNGALVPVIAIYPTIIIILVAIDRSHVERGISQHLESIPTPHLAITVDTITSLHESRNHHHRRSEVLVLDGYDSGFHGDGLADARRRTSE